MGPVFSILRFSSLTVARFLILFSLYNTKVCLHLLCSGAASLRSTFCLVDADFLDTEAFMQDSSVSITDASCEKLRSTGHHRLA